MNRINEPRNDSWRPSFASFLHSFRFSNKRNAAATCSVHPHPMFAFPSLFFHLQWIKQFTASGWRFRSSRGFCFMIAISRTKHSTWWENHPKALLISISGKMCKSRTVATSIIMFFPKICLPSALFTARNCRVRHTNWWRPSQFWNVALAFKLDSHAIGAPATYGCYEFYARDNNANSIRCANTQSFRTF